MISPEQIELADELLVEEPNPYRRRQKVVRIRRGSGWRGRVVKFGVGGVLLPAALLFGGDWAGRRVASSPLFFSRPEEDLKLSGNRIISAADVLAALRISDSSQYEDLSVFNLDLTAMRRRLEAVPWIESASVMRVFPNRIDVAVTERKPIAYANVGGRVDLVDRDGVFLQMPEKARLDFPILYGLGSGVSVPERKAMLGRYEQFLSETKGVVPGSGWSISEADLSDADDLRVLLVQGRQTVLVHFGDADYLQRFQTFVKVAPQVLSTTAKVDSVDLRFRGELVVDPVEAAAAPGLASESKRVMAPIHGHSRAKAARAKRRRRIGRSSRLR